MSHSLTEKDMKEVAGMFLGYSCSDIKVVVKEACMEPIRGLDSN
jgi:hypothetical protein